jgi:hypothetical protein
MKINQVLNTIRVGEVIVNKSPYNGNRYVLYPNKLKLVYDKNFPKQLKRKHVSLIYFFVVNGIIYKIGQSSNKSGIDGCMSFYMSAGQDDPGINRFAINYLIRNELENGNLVEVYMKYVDTIQVTVEGLFMKKTIEVPISAKGMEEISISEYISMEGEFPKWNYQESSISLPIEIHELFGQYKINRKK